MNRKIFINRRKPSNDRREASDPCSGLAVDLYHRKRRKSPERREERSLEEDYYAFVDNNNKGSVRIEQNKPSANSDLH